MVYWDITHDERSEEWVSPINHNYLLFNLYTQLAACQLIYEKFTLVPVLCIAIAWPIMLESIEELAKISREHLQRHWYWWFTQICLWGHGSEPQSHWGKAKNNRQGALTTSWESHRVSFQAKLIACSYTSANRQIFGILAKFNSSQKALRMEPAVWIFLWILSGYLFVCIPRRSLNDHYFIVIFFCLKTQI